MLGEEWRKTPDVEKLPYIRQEETERQQYKRKMAAWKKDKESSKAHQVQTEQKEHKFLKQNTPKAVKLEESPVESIQENPQASTEIPTTAPASLVDCQQQQLTESTQNSRMPSLDSKANELWWSQNAGVEPPNVNHDEGQAQVQSSRDRCEYDCDNCSIPSHQFSRYSPIQPSSGAHHAHENDAMFPPSSHVHPQTSHSAHSAMHSAYNTHSVRPGSTSSYPYHPEDVFSGTDWFQQNTRMMGGSASSGTIGNQGPTSHDAMLPQDAGYFENQRFKFDPELDCSPYGSYDEFDPTLIH